MSGRSTNFKHFELQEGADEVALSKASLSWMLSPTEKTFFRFDGSDSAPGPKKLVISASKARNFQSRGDGY